jgi:hypothetical protein
MIAARSSKISNSTVSKMWDANVACDICDFCDFSRRRGRNERREVLVFKQHFPQRPVFVSPIDFYGHACRLIRNALLEDFPFIT